MSMRTADRVKRKEKERHNTYSEKNIRVQVPAISPRQKKEEKKVNSNSM